MTSSKAVAAPSAWPEISLSALAEFAVPIAVLSIVMALILPLPGFVLDLLIVTDIMLSVVVMMVSMYIKRPVEFNVFPTTLLLLTLFRLALNVSSSRLILLNGNSGTAAAGHVIEAFGSFVVGGNYIIGAVIFLVLIAIQYVVINHGAVRISEVTARFTLDALPGKQMSIDADMNAGLIDESEARARRKALSAEAEFYGAMDGASRFTQRDAVAGILITAINIIAGFLIGVLQHGMELKKALETYTVLTIGDGLVTVIPALMISVSGGMIVTRASADKRLSAEFQQQLFGRHEPILLASGVLGALGIIPGLPTIPFLLMSVALGVGGWKLRTKTLAAPAKGAAAAAGAAKPARDNVEALLKVDPLAVEVGLGLVNLVEGGGNSPLLQRISAIRRQLATQIGYLLPPVKVNDNVGLRSREYIVLLKGVEVARYELPARHELAIPAGKTEPLTDGKKTKDPAFSLDAWWIPAERADAARRKGYTVVDAVNVLGTHLSEVIRRFAHEMLTRQDTKGILDRVALEHPKIVEDLVPKLLTLATVQRVLQNLLRERVSIRDAVSILEALGEAAVTTRNPVLLTEYVRQGIRRSLTKPFVSPRSDMNAWFLDPSIERMIEGAVEHGEHNSMLGLAPQAVRDVLTRIGRAIERPESQSVVIAGSAVRYFLRQILEMSLPGVTVLAHNEIPPGVKVISMGVIS